MAARYGHLINKWTVAAVAGLALMAVLLAAALPAWAQDLPPQVVSPTTTFDYAENGTGPIISYSARDPEGNRVFWTLGGPDAADFTIDGGTLPLQESPRLRESHRPGGCRSCPARCRRQQHLPGDGAVRRRRRGRRPRPR